MLAQLGPQPPDRLPYDHETFVNREDELRLVHERVKQLAFSTPEWRVLVFRGARGVGKSWLLQEIQYQLRRQNPAAGPAVYVNLTQFSALPVEEAVHEVLQDIDNEVADWNGAPHQLLAGSLAGQVGVVVGHARQLSSVLVMLFDYVDESASDLLDRLENHCLSPFAVEPKTLIVLAGRGRDYIWRGVELRLKSEEHELLPFDSPLTRAQLNKQAPQAVDYAREIYELSGGNPWTNFLLRTLPASKAVALHRTKKVLLGSETRGLVSTYLDALSVLRAFDENRMPAVFAAYFRRPASDWTYADCREIRNQLIEARLARWAREQGEFRLDHAIQAIVERVLYETDRARWVALHCAAYCLYRDWVRRYPRTKERWQAEADYHFQCLQLAHKADCECPSQEEK